MNWGTLWLKIVEEFADYRKALWKDYLCILVRVETNVNELSSFSLKQDCKAMHLQTFA